MAIKLTWKFVEAELDAIAAHEGRVVVIVSSDANIDQLGRRVNKLTRGAVARAIESEAFEKASLGQIISLNYPAYEFSDHKTENAEDKDAAITVMMSRAAEQRTACETALAIVDGVHFTRDLTNEPSNILTTTEFANRLVALKDHGVEVEVLDEADLENLGMRALLGVGQGSDSPSKVVVMQWNGGAENAQPFALIGKGVVFDTGGISLKPAGGMEDMTMDMGGAGVVAGTMLSLAKRKAAANVVALVGLVENMPSGNAQRPGDVVTSMKGDTIEVINTDAEGRLVLCDVMWYAQERFNPTGMIDLATLTGAIIIGLGHENAGVFSNDDALCDGLLAAAKKQGEGAWRMPLGEAYDKKLKSRIADVKNVGDRAAGSITAAAFLQRFVKDNTPWAHIDIAGVASTKTETPYAPVGASGWGVMTLNQLIRDMCEKD
ncbi:MAG: leucyl aminopeptidase [Rhodobacteraceae bacterium]|nr:leucyl aminopeptidase [Paracoccaceae bacterium]